MSSLLSRTVLVGIATLALIGAAHAAGTPAQTCAAATLKASGKATNAAITCHVKATQRGLTVDASCLAKAGLKLAADFAKAEARGGCTTAGDAGAMDGLIDAHVDALVAVLRPVATANRCAAAKLKAAGKSAQSQLGCHAAATKLGGTADPACLAKAETRCTAAFAKAEGSSPCFTTGDAGAIGAAVDTLVGDAVALAPATTTTTSTTTTTTLPGEGCPCFTSAQLAGTPLDLFDAYGGAVCSLEGIASADECDLPQPGGPPLEFPRVAIGVFSGAFCGGYGDLDPDDDGTCNGAPTIVSVTGPERQACTDVLLASQLHQSACP